MKPSIIFFPLLVLFFSAVNVSFVAAEDMRAAGIEFAKTKTDLIRKAAAERAAAEKAAAQSIKEIEADKSKLESAVAALKKKKSAIENEVDRLTAEESELAKNEQELDGQLSVTDQMVGELVGAIRLNAKDADNLLRGDLQTALGKGTPSFLAGLAAEENFPGMGEIHTLTETLFTQIQRSREVSLNPVTVIDREGKNREAEALVIGPFCAAYRLVGGEIGFLRYSPEENKFYALTKLPPSFMQKELREYMDGKSDDVPVDIGRGAALQQLSHRLDFKEQIKSGGILVWPILALFIWGVLIVVERSWYLFRHHLGGDRFMGTLAPLLSAGKYAEALELCRKNSGKPLAEVLGKGVEERNCDREKLESVLQEAILRKIPELERFLSTLGMLAAIAPLLGLLGTVTGMIDTFHVITLFGTGDPRMMSGGISEALVTTMLGLGAAIPLLLAQALIGRSVEKEIGTMEEKAVALVNILGKTNP